MSFKVAREEIPRHPTVDPEKCVGCRACFEFCSHGTYTWDDQLNKPVVKNPNNCVVGCSGCAPECPNEAIAFPPLAILRKYITG